MREKRALYYSHDSLGLGHLRRTLLISEGMNRQFPELSSLIVTGSAMIQAFRVSPRLDYVKLPSVTKIAREEYRSRALNLSFTETLGLRRELLFQTAANYAPDFVFVDTVPCGLRGELLKTLRYLREDRPETRIYLILRDILDDPSLLIPAWKELGAFRALEDYYDRIFVCGHPWIYDPVREYDFPTSLHSRVQFCGYLERGFDEEMSANIRAELTAGGEKLIVVTTGGGDDGEHLIGTFLASLGQIRAQVPANVVLLLGPEMAHGQARLLTASVKEDPGVRVMDFSSHSVSHMAAADLIVSMGGYNTVNEIMWLGKPAIVAPRVEPRREQLIRSRRMAELGLLQMIHPRDLTASTLTAKVTESLSAPAPIPVVPVQFSGAETVAREVRLQTAESNRSIKPISKRVSSRG